MNIAFIILGIVLLTGGAWLTITQSKTMQANKKDDPKGYYKGFALGIVCIIIGIAVIVKHLIN